MMHGVRNKHLKALALKNQALADGILPICKELGQCLELSLRCLQAHQSQLYCARCILTPERCTTCSVSVQ